MTAVLLTALVGLAAAQDPNAPLAQAPAMSAAVTPSATVSEAQLARLKAYKARRLRVVTETELRTSLSPAASEALSTAQHRGDTVVVADPAYTLETWGIYRGNTRLSPSDFLHTTGETFRADDVHHRIERDERRARRWLTVAAMGGASLAAGLYGSRVAEDLPQELLARQLTVGGIGVGTAGLMAASVPTTRADRLKRYPSALMDRAQAEAMVARHNEALAKELGLTADDRRLMELADAL